MKRKEKPAFNKRAGTVFALDYGRLMGLTYHSAGEAFVGDIGGKTAFIVDDLISGGTTLARAATACRAQGARRIIAAASHGLFNGAAATVLAESALEKLLVTDTVPPFRLPPTLLDGTVEVPETAALFAEAISRLHDGGRWSSCWATDPDQGKSGRRRFSLREAGRLSRTSHVFRPDRTTQAAGRATVDVGTWRSGPSSNVVTASHGRTSCNRHCRRHPSKR